MRPESKTRRFTTSRRDHQSYAKTRSIERRKERRAKITIQTVSVTARMQQVIDRD